MGNCSLGFQNKISGWIHEKPEELNPMKKRKQSPAEELTNCKKSRMDTQNTPSLNEVINLGIPHVGELIFESIDTPELFQFALVSETWKVLAENALIKRWKGKMLEACKSGETNVVQLLLERCNSEECGLNTKDVDGWSPIMLACKNGHKDVVQLLMDMSDINIDLNARTNHGTTAFIGACREGHKDVVQLLLENSNIDLKARDNEGYSAFTFACQKGHTNVVKLLLDHSERIELNARTIDGWTAFMIACFRVHKDVVQLLLDLSDRIELNARKNNGRTAFMIACRSGNKDLVKLLLDYSEVIDINIPESFQLSEEIKTILKMHSMKVQK